MLGQSLAEAMQQLGGMTDELPQQIELAAKQIADRFIQGHQLLILAPPTARPLGQLFCHSLIHRQAATRPPMPALLLNPNMYTFADDQSANGETEALFRQARALASSNDILLFLHDHDNAALRDSLNNFSLHSGTKSIYIGPMTDQPLAISTSQTIYIPLENTSIARMHEMTLFILNCLSDMIDDYVFGSH